MFLFVIVVAVCLKSLNGFHKGFQNGHSVRQVKCMNLYLNPKPILQNENQLNSLMSLSFKKNQNTITSQDVDDAIVVSKSAATKGTDILINVLYKGLLIEPVFGSLGLLKSTEEIKKEKDLKILTIPSIIRSNVSKNNNNKSREPFESKLASMMSLEEETILNENNMKDNILSVTMAPKSKSISPSSTSKPATVAFTSTTNTAPSSSSTALKKADFKDELWVVKKLKEIRTRENEVSQSSPSSSAPSAVTKVTKSPPINTSSNSILKPSISTNGVSATAAATPVKSAFVSKTPPPVTTASTTPVVRTPSLTMVSSSNTDKIKSAMSNFFSPQPPVGTVATSPAAINNKIATTADEAVAMAITSSSLASSSTSTTTSTDSSNTSLQSEAFYELLPTSIISEGLVYGNVDKNAVEFDISADTFKLPIINVEENTEFTAAQQAIKTAGVSGTLAYALSEVGFWVVSVPIIVSSYHTSTNEWLNIGDPTDRSVIFGLSAGFMSVARLALPFRLAVAVGLTPFVDKFITKKFLHGNGNSEGSDVINSKDIKIAPSVVTITPPVIATPSPVASAVNNGFGSREPWLIRKFKEMRSSASSASRV